MAVDKKKLDLQTISLFLTLAVLTGFAVLGLRWILLTPEPIRVPTPPAVESASK